jgi:hypothetical protein
MPWVAALAVSRVAQDGAAEGSGGCSAQPISSGELIGWGASDVVEDVTEKASFCGRLEQGEMLCLEHRRS